ncbi:MAG: zinc dependent phospholipase C family protein [Bacteroidetes bacterium]|nr:zinc dependent phospholipase C family protein [Bacteroidota bacterium]
MKKGLLILLFTLPYLPSYCWGFFAHRKINYYAVFLLPPEMIAFYKPHIAFLSDHAVDPDKKRYLVPGEAAHHYIDIDYYGAAPYSSLPRQWDSAVKKFTRDTLLAKGILPWYVPQALAQLTHAFKEQNTSKILLLSAAIGHYIADAHVPLHACMNHNGQLTGQQGIHAFWESRLPELLADREWDFFMDKAAYISSPSGFMWKTVLESAAAADTVLRAEKQLSRQFSPDKRFGFEERNGLLVRQYSTAYSIAYNRLLKGMTERRMRQSIHAVASFWYTAWVNAGQPDLKALSQARFSDEDLKQLENMETQWRNAKKTNDCY